MPKTYNQLAGQRLHRIEALSDGVFSIAMTLLVLDIRVPVSNAIQEEMDLFTALVGITPKLLSYLLSFMTLGIFWVGHSTQFDYIRRSDRHLTWLSIFFLMFVSILPFTTAFLSAYIEFKLAIAIYWFNIFALGVLIYLHWSYAYKNNYLDENLQHAHFIDKAIRKRVFIAQCLYAGGALLCLINNYLSIFVIILIQLNYALAFFFRPKLPINKEEVNRK